MFIKRTQRRSDFFTPGASPVHCECDKTFWWQWGPLPWLSSWSVSLEKIILCCSFKIFIVRYLKDDFFNAQEIPFFRFGSFGGFVLSLCYALISTRWQMHLPSCRISTLGIYFVVHVPVYEITSSALFVVTERKLVKKKHNATISGTLCHVKEGSGCVLFFTNMVWFLRYVI